MRHRIGRPRFMQSFASGGAGTPFASTAAIDVSFAPAGNISSTNVQAALQELDNEKVAKAGDTMTGFLVLNAPPVLDLQAATKKYVDDKVAAGGGYTDEMAMDAVAAMIKNGTNITWAYDDVLNSLTPTVNVTNMAAGSIGFTPAGNVGSNNVQAAIQELDNEKVAKSGDTMTGPLLLPADPTLALHAATKQYTDQLRTDTVNGLNSKVAKAGDTMTGDLIIAKINPIFALDGTQPSQNHIVGRKGGLDRWTMQFGNNSAEGGSNAGSDFALYAYGDAGIGSVLGRAFGVKRSTRDVTFDSTSVSSSPTTGAVTVAGGVGIAGALYTGGIIVIAKSTPILYMNDLGGAGNYISAQKNGLSRWEMSLGAGAESGSNAGSDFTLNRYNDAGGLLGSALVIRRNNGDMTVGGGLVVQAADPTMYFQKAADANVAQMYVMSAGAARWLWHYADQNNNNLQVYRCNAAGGIVDGPFGINWATGKITMSSSIPSTSPTTGALTVAGGVGIGGNLNVGGNSLLVGSNAGTTVLRLDGGGGTTAGSQLLFVTNATARFVIGNASSITGGAQNDDFLLWMSNASPNSAFRANAINSAITLGSSVPATSSTTGALTLPGGLGVGGNIYAGAMIHSPAGITVSPSLPDTNHSMTFDATVNGPFIAGFQGVALGIQTVKYLTITGGGEMNLGTAVPGYKFGMTFPGGGVQYGFGIKQSADTTVAIQFINAAGTPMGNISTGSAAVAYNTSSDKRLKKNLKKFDSNKIIDKIEVYDFEWKSSGERGLGVIAQDVYEVYPQAITHDERDDNWFVDYSKFAPLMLQELKSLRARVGKIEKSTNHRRGV